MSFFAAAVRRDAPAPARVETIRSEPVPPARGSFVIAASGAGAFQARDRAARHRDV